ncbi:unnamed protein product [Aspergillus oryzae]|nr:unnamed protein product [Aspergillus oryzae]
MDTHTHTHRGLAAHLLYSLSRSRHSVGRSHGHQNPNYNVYTVGWICIVSSEMNAARALLDEEHESLPPKPTDDNSYLLGRKNGHNVVIGYPGSGLYGPHNASHVATNMVRTFPISGLGCWLESVVERREPPMLRIRGMAFDWEMLLLVIRRGVMVRSIDEVPWLLSVSILTRAQEAFYTTTRTNSKIMECSISLPI